MKMQVKKICLFIITFILINGSFAQTDMLFWFVAPEINDAHSSTQPADLRGQPTYLRFSNAENFDIKVTITQPANVSFIPIEVDVLANSTKSILFRRGEYNGIDTFDLNTIENYIITTPASPPSSSRKCYKQRIKN